MLGKSRMVRNLTEHDFTGSCPTPSDRFAVPALVEWPCSPVRPRGTRRSRPVDLNEVRRKQTPERRDVMMQVRGVPSGFRLDELIVTSIRRSWPVGPAVDQVTSATSKQFASAFRISEPPVLFELERANRIQLRGADRWPDREQQIESQCQQQRKAGGRPIEDERELRACGSRL
jgi:hypothetical protein